MELVGVRVKIKKNVRMSARMCVRFVEGMKGKKNFWREK